MKLIRNSTFFILNSTFALALVLQAQAEQSWAAIYSEAYSAKDTKPSTENRENYTAYYCTKAAAEEMFGEGVTTRAAVENYLKANFSEGKSAMEETSADAGNYAIKGGDFTVGQYTFIETFANQIAAGTYLAVAFYQDDAFRVFESADVESGNLVFDSAEAGVAGSWQTVPEPTSGMLLLLGLAGLALKRKQIGG